MTYADDIDGDELDISFRLRFEGIERVITQRVFGDGELAALADVSSGEARLDRRRNVVLPSGFSATLIASDDVLDYFARRGGTEVALPAALTAASTTITVGTTNVYPDGSTIYLDRETIVLGTGTEGVYVGCTRGAFSSTADYHAGGAFISDRPRYWRRRRAWLEAVSHPSGSVGGVMGGVLAESPSVSDPSVRLEFLDIMTELNRPIYTGWGDTAVEKRAGIEGGYRLTVADPRQITENGNVSSLEAKGHVRITDADDDGAWVIVRLGSATAISVVNRTVNVFTSNVVWGTVSLDDLMGGGAWVMRQVLVLTGDPGEVALALMMSVLGDSTNGAYDRLPGAEADGTDLGRRRTGAGLPADAVNVDSWSAWQTEPLADGASLFTPIVAKWVSTGPPLTLLIDEPTRLVDVLSHEIMWRMGGYIYADSAGRLSMRRYDGAVPAALLPTLDWDRFGQAAVGYRDDEGEVISRVIFDSSWSPISRSFLRRDEVVFPSSLPIYGEETSSASFQSRSLIVGAASSSPLASPPIPASSLELQADRMASRTKRGVERFPVRVPWRYSQLAVGSRVLLVDSRIPNGVGSRGLTELQCEVVGERWDLASMEKQIILEAVGGGWLIAPSAVVGTMATSDSVPVLTSLSINEKPGRDFTPAWRVRVFYGPGLTTSEVAEVKTVTDGSLELTAALSGGAPSVGSVVILEPHDVGGANQWGAGVFDHAFMADASGGLGIGDPWEREAARWQ